MTFAGGLVAKSRLILATLWTIVRQAPQSMGFSRQAYWSGLPFPSPGELPNPGIEPRSLAFQADSFPAELSGHPKNSKTGTSVVVQWLRFHLPVQGGRREGAGWISDQGAKISHALQPKKQNIKNKSNNETNSMNTLKNSPHQNNLKEKKRTLRFDIRGVITIQWGFIEGEIRLSS